MNSDAFPRSFLRWAGSKRQLLRRLTTFWRPHHSRYVEPFAGSSALFFALRPANALIADKNAALIETYEIVRKHPVNVHRRVIAFNSNKHTYYKVRAQNPSCLSPLDRAARFIYLNRHCFNGLYRTNVRGQFNVPYADPAKSGRFPTVEEFKATAEMLAVATLRSCDFGVTLRHVRRADFVYLDPPYAVESRRVFREYGARCFTKRDLHRLAKHLERLDAVGASFVLSYADCSEARHVFARWSRTRVRVRRNIAGFSGARRQAYELLFSNHR